jgi:Domain of unknown function (DUF4349)
MNLSTRQRFKKYSLRMLWLFAVLFLFRLTYGYLKTDDSRLHVEANDFVSENQFSKRNYASEKINKQAAPDMVSATSQKYEKTATLKTQSTQFEADDEQVRQTTKRFNGVIQYEQRRGNNGARELFLMIGIPPQLFDSSYQELRKIGNIISTEITKVDKTNEYRQLNAKKVSLEKNLSSLYELKNSGGSISDYVTLHEKILALETELQNLGVELGNFDTENEFCTIRLSIYEGQPKSKISFIHRVKVALEWTIKYYALLVFSLLPMSGFVYICILILYKTGFIKEQ